MLSTTARATSVAVKAPTAMENKAFIDGLIGTRQIGSPGEAALATALTTQLNRGMPRHQVVLNLLRSTPARRVQVSAEFVRLLGRLPKAAELQTWTARTRDAGDTRPLNLAIFGSREYDKRSGNGTKAGYVTALYRDILKRDPSAAELNSGVSSLRGANARTRLAQRLLTSVEGLTVQINGVQKLMSLRPPGPQANDFLVLSRRGGLTVLTARALASEFTFSQIVHPASPPRADLGTAFNHPPGFPIAPGFDLASRTQELDVPVSFTNVVRTLGVGSDDVPWYGTDSGLSTFDVNSATLTPKWTGGPVDSIAAIGANEAYAVVERVRPLPSILHVLNGATSYLPNLPGSDIPTQVAAGPDGTVWALGQSGGIYAYSAVGQAWTSISTDGYAIKSISVGSADNIWALTASGAGLQYSSATGFQPDSFLKSDVLAIQATFDGAVWAVAGVGTSNYVFMKPSFGVWKLAPAQPPQSDLAYFAAGSMNRAFETGLDVSKAGASLPTYLITIGVADRQPMPFPAYTGSYQTAYLELSQAAKVTLAAGVRGLYNQPGQDWAGLQSDIQNAVVPANVPADIWTSVQSELATELLYVGEVYGRLTLMQTLYTEIQTVNNGALAAAAKIVQLTDEDQQNSIISLIFEDFFEAIAASVSSIGIPAAGATLAAFLSSGFDSALSILEGSNPPNSKNAIPIAYAQLQTTLDTLYVNALNTINTQITNIVTDSGKLAAVGQAIVTKVWPYSNQEMSQQLTATQAVYNEFFYQSLTASKWQIVHTPYGNYVVNPPNLPVPSYAIFAIPDGYQDGMPIEHLYFMNKIGASHDLSSTDLGPFPDSLLFTTIAGLGNSTTTDFWTGANGWSIIPRVEATL
ncbi:DUF4214 domain-containing protein [Isosphaeraceae bacterium EP7]